MDRQVARRIVAFLEERVAPREDPRSVGKPLLGKKYLDQWRYRVGDYRILAEIKDDVVTILIVEIGHRREVYR
jgi:mRNA interferase RelE/StbE